MISVSFSQASELCSKIHKWQEVRYLKFQHGLPHIWLQHVVVGSDAGAGVVRVIQSALEKEAKKENIMVFPPLLWVVTNKHCGPADIFLLLS